jgi:hypothetical protein
VGERVRQSEVPELAGLAEVATILGVSKQRVRELSEQDETFPLPIAELSGGAIYLKSMIDEFNRRWIRQTGRPSKAHSAVPRELEHIPRDRSDLGQQMLRMVYNAIRRHDLGIDPLTPRGQSLFHSIEQTRAQEEGFIPRYDESFFELEPPDTRYSTLHAACCPDAGRSTAVS